MRKRYLFGTVLTAVLLQTSCASRFVFVAQQSCAEATELKTICTNLEHQAPERLLADSLYNQGAMLIRTGKYENAHKLLTRVIVKYRLILLHHAIALKEQEIALQKRGLSGDLNELSTCRRIIEELSPTEQP